MILVALSAITFLQSSTSPDRVSFPTGATSELKSLVTKIASESRQGHWDQARGLAALLPSPQVKVAWSVADAPKDLKEDIEEARDQAFYELGLKVNNFKATVGATGTLAIRYADVKATQITYGQVPGKPWITITYPLVRGKKQHVVGKIEVRNDVAYALCKFFGIADSLRPVTISGRTDETEAGNYLGIGPEVGMARNNLLFTDKLQRMVLAKRPFSVGTPIAKLGSATIELATVTQGETAEFEISLSNSGSEELVANLRPDCGCIVAEPKVIVGPGKTVNTQLSIDTVERVGDVARSVMVVTNDPTHPILEVKVHVVVRPRYRFILPPGSTIVLGEEKKPTEIFLVFSPEMMTSLTTCQLDGAAGEVSMEKWRGDVTDAASNETLRGVFGYKFTVNMSEKQVPGRSPGTISMRTNDEKFPVLRTTFYVQKGIVTMPDNIYAGDLGRTAQDFNILVSRPGKPFKILGMSATSPRLTFKATSLPGGDYRVTARFDGKAQAGDFSAKIQIKTDDPKQPVLEIPIRGVAR